MTDDKKRFFSKAEGYDKIARYLVPQYDFLQDEALSLLPAHLSSDVSVIDLGAGSGILLEKVLSKYSNTKCYWVDYSDDHLAVASRRLAKFGDRVEFIFSALEEEWEGQIDGLAGAILSMSAIHHLETEDKKTLLKRCHAKLKSGGWFVNIDEMKTACPGAYVRSMRFWVEYVAEIASEIPEDLRDEYTVWKTRIDNWASRNIDNVGKPKSKGDDIHEDFIEQLQWLKSAGFVNVDLFLKYHLWCVIGGQKELEDRA